MSEAIDPLRRLGWDDDFAASFVARCPGGGLPGRVARVDRGGWVTLATGTQDVRGRLHPRFRRPPDPLARPTVGDWVVCPPDAAGEPVLEVVLPRRTVIVRNTGGDERDVSQALAANVDTAFLALPLDGDRNPRRTDRFITLVRSGGVEPVLVLTKADRADATAVRRAEEEARRHGTAVHTVSAWTGAGLEQLDPYLGTGRTVVLLGVSGAGKSTLVNRLLGADALPTGEVRADGRGRHTTSHRALVPLAEGGVLIDTPGLRSVAAWENGVEESFADVEAHAARCRFRDCSHRGEPGCAVEMALASGELDPQRWDSYQRLRSEAKALERRRRRTRSRR